MNTLQKYAETLEKERQNERSMRFKLEEEYMQNAKNHEEEVHLRMKFEAKLNEMHGELRDLNTKYQRSQIELKEATTDKENLTVQINAKNIEMTKLNQTIVDTENRMKNQIEKIASLDREIAIKGNQVQEFKERIEKAADDFELAQYKVQEQQKISTEQRLKLDVLQSLND